MVFRVGQLRSASLLEGVFGAVHRRFSGFLLAVGWMGPVLALSSHLLSDVDYTERAAERKGCAHFISIK